MNAANKTTWKQTLLSLVVSVIFLGVLGWLLWTLVTAVFTLPKDIAGPTITASLTALAALSGVLISKYFERKKDIEQELRKQKVEIYSELMVFMFKILQGSKSSIDTISEDDMTRFIMSWTPKII